MEGGAAAGEGAAEEAGGAGAAAELGAAQFWLFCVGAAGDAAGEFCAWG